MKTPQAIALVLLLCVVSGFAIFSIVKLNPVTNQTQPHAFAVPVAPPPPTPGQLMTQAGQLTLQRNKEQAKAIYNRVVAENSGSFFGKIADQRLKEPGLEGYFKSLNETNSDVYVVQMGDTLDKIARQYGVTSGLIRLGNGLPGDVIRPNQSLKIMKEKWRLVADKTTNTMSLIAGEQVVKTYPIGTGKESSTPVGEFKIVNRLKNPTWYHEGTVAPPGSPENPLGTRWMGFDVESYGLHGTIDPESIGQSQSLGCIRMLNPEVEELFELLPLGTPIKVVESG